MDLGILRSVRNICLVLALVALALSFVQPLLSCVTVPLFAVVCLSSIGSHLYRPPEDHVGVIYRIDRFRRWVNPNEWTVLNPWLDRVECEMNTRPQISEVETSDLETAEHIQVYAKFKVFYLMDPRRITISDFQSTLIRMRTGDLNRVVEDTLRSLAQSTVMDMELDGLLRHYSRGHFAERLSKKLSDRLQPLGLIINPDSAVNVVELHPEAMVRKAFVAQFVANHEGEANYKRLQPIIDAARGRPAQEALAIWLAMNASTVARDGQPAGPVFSTWRWRTEEELLSLLAQSIQYNEVANTPVSNGYVNGRSKRAV